MGFVRGCSFCVFLSTLSLRRATGRVNLLRFKRVISIHALLAESDRRGVLCYLDNIDFYPRSPCGERRQGVDGSGKRSTSFLSTLSLRRATKATAWITCRILYFYPRSPCGERLACAGWFQVVYNFYPRSPCGERLAAWKPDYVR